jgi:hypothetical protein
MRLTVASVLALLVVAAIPTLAQGQTVIYVAPRYRVQPVYTYVDQPPPPPAPPPMLVPPRMLLPSAGASRRRPSTRAWRARTT